MDILKVEMKKLDNEVLKVSVKEQLREAYKADIEDLEYVQLEFSTFCKNQQFYLSSVTERITSFLSKTALHLVRN